MASSGGFNSIIVNQKSHVVSTPNFTWIADENHRLGIKLQYTSNWLGPFEYNRAEWFDSPHQITSKSFEADVRIDLIPYLAKNAVDFSQQAQSFFGRTIPGFVIFTTFTWE
ncbi:MAG: hypothetical protein WAZ77_19430 [Candidatus Nitrosopolaris sp.]